MLTALAACTLTTFHHPAPSAPVSLPGELRPVLPVRAATVETPAPVHRHPFDELAACESGAWRDGRPHGPANWHYNGDHGDQYLGGLNWLRSTWDAVAPEGFPGPVEASREQEIHVAELLLAQPWGGWGHWPTCARLLGLR